MIGFVAHLPSVAVLGRLSSRSALSPIRSSTFLRPATQPASSRPRQAYSTATTTTPTMGATDHLKEGDSVPDVIFKTRERIPSLEGKTENPFDWVDKSTSEIFSGKRVVIFALPGAFTPTCSTTHVPGYEADYEAIVSKGISDIYCLSVNDAFVMYQWSLKQGAEKVKMLPDGACAFTRGMGMSCVWDSERGFGERSWRYSMVVDDGKIEKMFVEPDFVQNSGPDPFEVSDSKTMLAYLSSK